MKAFLVLALLSFAVLGCSNSSSGGDQDPVHHLMSLEAEGQAVGVKISYDGDGCHYDQAGHGDYDDCREVIAVSTRDVRCTDRDLEAAIDYIRDYESAVEHADVYDKSAKVNVLNNAIAELQDKLTSLHETHSCD